jgi:hypothetical protein
MKQRGDGRRLLAFALIAISGIWVVLALTVWRSLVNGPRVGSPWSNYGYGQALLFEVGVQIVPTIVALFWNLAAAIIGYYLVVSPIFGRQRLTVPVWLLIAGKLPGMLIVIAASRLATLIAPNTFAPGLLLIAIFAAALLSLYGIVRREENWQTRGFGKHWLWPAVLALLSALVFSVHVDRAHVAAEGSVWFITDVFLSKQFGIGTGGYWPLISQHYDEAAFLYPVVYGLVRPDDTASATLTAIYWITLAFDRLSIATFTYIALRALGVDRLSSLLVLAFFCGASLSINPISSRVLFDSLSPLAYALHVSRILVPVLPLILIAMVTGLRPTLSYQSLAIAVILGIGLSSITVHVAIVLLWALSTVALTLLSPEAGGKPQVWRSAAAAAMAIMVAFTVSYGMPALSDVARVGVLLAGGAIAAGILCGAAWLDRGRSDRREVLSAACLLLSAGTGYVLGLLLLGNVLIPRTLPLLDTLWPWSHSVVLERFYSTLAAPVMGLVKSPYCDGGYYWGYRLLTGHCASLAMLARTYGLAFVIMTCVVAWGLIRWPKPAVVADRLLSPWLWGTMMSLVAMPFGFILFDFVSAIGSAIEGENQLSIWLRSRLIEPWFYGGSLLALALFLRAATSRERRFVQSAMMIATATFALSSLVLPAQLIANFAFLFDAARKF